MSFQYEQKDKLVYLTSSLLEGDGVSHMYCTKQGGTSTGSHESLSFRYTGGNNEASVHENFSIVAEALGGSFDDVVRTQQVHKNKVVKVTGGHGYRIVANDNDGLITNVPGVILSGFYADCQVILFHDPVRKAIGVAHSGWRGTALDISKEIIVQMTESYGTNPADLLCSIGPAICQDCFECDEDVVIAFRQAFGDGVLRHIKQIGKKYHPNIGEITRERLLAAGVRDNHIDICPICTYCDDSKLYWSHRKVGENRGVHGAFIRLIP